MQINKKTAQMIYPCGLYGAGEQNRTADLFITNEVHYHCATPACHSKTSNIISDFAAFVNRLLRFFYCERENAVTVLVSNTFLLQVGCCSRRVSATALVR